MVLPCILSHKQTAFISCTLFKASACIFVCAVSVLLSLTNIIHTKLCLSFVRHVYIVTNAHFSFICICLCVCLHVSAQAATGWFFVELDIGDLMKTCQETPHLVKIRYVLGTSHKDLSTFMLLTVKILCRSTTVQREIIIAFL